MNANRVYLRKAAALALCAATACALFFGCAKPAAQPTEAAASTSAAAAAQQTEAAEATTTAAAKASEEATTEAQQAEAATTAAKEPEGTTAAAATQAPAETEAANGGGDNGGGPFGKYEPGITLSVARGVGASVLFDSTDPQRKSIEDNVWMDAYREKLGINITYKWTVPSDQLLTKWNLAISSNDLPDIGAMPLSIFNQLAEAGMVEDMTDLYDEYASPLYRQANESDGGLAITYASYEKRLMGVPLPGFQPDNCSMLFVRKDWLDNLGLEIPKTIDDFVNVATAFREQDPDGNGKKDTWGFGASQDITGGVCSFVGFMNAYNAYYGIWVERDGGLAFGSVQPEMKDALLALQKIYKDDLIRKDFATVTAMEAAEGIAAEEIGMIFGVSIAPVVKIMDTYATNPKVEWVSALLPTLDEKPVKPQAGASMGSAVVAFKGVKDPAALIKIANLDLELYMKESVPYNSDGKGHNLHQYRVCESLALPWKNLDIYKNLKYFRETGDKSVIVDQTAEVYDAIENGEPSVKAANMLMFWENGSFGIVDQIRENNQWTLDQFRTAQTETMLERNKTLNDLLSETFLKIIMGDSGDAFDSVVADWRQRGGDKITQEVNDWYQKSK